MDVQILSMKFRDYSKYIRNVSQDTINRYQRVINLFCNNLNITEMEEINDVKVRNFFIEGRTKRNWKSATYISYHNTLNVFFEWCIKEGHMMINPVADIETPKLEKTLPPKLTKQEAFRLLEVVYNYPYPYTYLRYRNHAIFSTFLFAGIRKKELLNLKVTDIDIDNLTLFVRQGKGAKDRIVPITYRLAESLKKYQAERVRLKKTCPEFFTSLNRDMGFTTIGMKRLVLKMREAAGFKFTIHQLRHTFATLMLEGGCDIYSLSRMHGHNNIKTTTIYLAASAEHLRSQMMKHPLNDL